MDIRTEKGQHRKRCEQWVGDQLGKHFNMTFLHTHDAAKVDGFLCDPNSDIKYAVEIKCRGEGYSQFQQWGTYMISESKLQEGRVIANLLNIPFVIAIRTGFHSDSLAEKKLCLLWICDENGNEITKPTKTVKQKTTTSVNDSTRRFDTLTHFNVDSFEMIIG